MDAFTRKLDTIKQVKMSDKSQLIILIIALLFPLACTVFPTPTGPCTATSQSDVIAYQRPSILAQVFGVLSAGHEVEIQGNTVDGWLGFDPGVAQAGNVGVFRLRWIEGSSDVVLEGDCESLPVGVGPPPGVWCTMAMAGIDVHEAARARPPRDRRARSPQQPCGPRSRPPRSPRASSPRSSPRRRRRSRASRARDRPRSVATSRGPSPPCAR